MYRQDTQATRSRCRQGNRTETHRRPHRCRRPVQSHTFRAGNHHPTHMACRRACPPSTGTHRCPDRAPAATVRPTRARSSPRGGLGCICAASHRTGNVIDSFAGSPALVNKKPRSGLADSSDVLGRGLSSPTSSSCSVKTATVTRTGGRASRRAIWLQWSGSGRSLALPSRQTSIPALRRLCEKRRPPSVDKSSPVRHSLSMPRSSNGLVAGHPRSM
jgi:hypothetical protein